MEQAAIKSGAMGPPDRRSQGTKGGSHTVLGDTMPQGTAAVGNSGGSGPGTATPHVGGDGQQTQHHSKLIEGGAANANNGAIGGGDVLGSTTVTGHAPSGMPGATASSAADENLPPSSGDSLEQIYQSTRTWCRTLRRYPNAMEVLLSFESKNPRPHSGILFNQYLSDLTGIMYRRLSTTVEEEVSRHSYSFYQRG